MRRRPEATDPNLRECSPLTGWGALRTGPTTTSPRYIQIDAEGRTRSLRTGSSVTPMRSMNPPQTEPRELPSSHVGSARIDLPASAPLCSPDHLYEVFKSS